MMYTLGKDYNPGFSMALSVADITDPESVVCRSYKILFFQQGSAILNTGENNQVITAPAILCLDENVKLDILDKEELKGRILLFHPDIVNEKFSFESLNGDRSDFSSNDHIDAFFFTPFSSNRKQIKELQIINPITSKSINDLYLQINRELTVQRDNLWPCRSRAVFIELLSLLNKIESFPDKTFLDKSFEIDNELVQKLILHLHCHYSEKITLSDLSAQFNTNRTRLHNLFKTATDMSIMEYLLQLRIHLSSTFLRDTGLPIAEIMERTGFTNGTYFSRIYKQKTGFSPGSYRKKYNKYFEDC